MPDYFSAILTALVLWCYGVMVLWCYGVKFSMFYNTLTP